MKTLILYGHHIEETKICRQIAEEYLRRFSPNPELVRVMGLKKGVNARVKSSEIRAYEEISNLIEEHKPKIIVDLHHNCEIRGKLEKPRISCSVNNDNSLLNFLEENQDASIFLLHPQAYSRFSLLKNIFSGIVQAADKNKTTCLEVETYLKGKNWNFSNCRQNKESIEQTLSFLGAFQQYSEMKYAEK